jgi:hypothetical protein
MQYQIQTSESRKAYQTVQTFSSKGNALAAIYNRRFDVGTKIRVAMVDPRTGAQIILGRTVQE